jgi:hypothetical protein
MKASYGIGLCVLLASSTIAIDWENFKSYPSLMSYPEEKMASWKEDLKDPEKLKKALKHCLIRKTGPNSFQSDGIPAFIKKFDVKDEVLRSALLGIYHEMAQNFMSICDENNPNRSFDFFVFDRAIEHMGVLADEPMKAFLMDIAKNSVKALPDRIQRPALGAYLGCANAQETRDLCVYFLSDETRLTDNIKDAIKSYISYDNEDKQKWDAILASLRVIAAREKDWQEFARWDDFLYTRTDDDYFTSRQRLELLKRHVASEPADAKGGEVPTLRKRLKEMLELTEPLTNISTNLTELKARDFSK